MFSKASNFTPKSVFAHSADIIKRKNPDGSVVIMSISDEDLFYKVTGVAAEIFDHLDGKTAVETIVNAVSTNYDVSRDQINKDTETFLKKLVDLKLVSVE